MYIALSIVSFLFLLSCIVVDKNTDISQLSPFTEYMGVPLTLKDEYVLCENYDFKVIDEPYFIFKDDNRAGLRKVEFLPKGTEIILSKAKEFKLGLASVSGTYVVGKVYSKTFQKEVAFYYRWGAKENKAYNDSLPTYWVFDKAMWQEKKDTTKFLKSSYKIEKYKP